MRKSGATVSGGGLAAPARKRARNYNGNIFYPAEDYDYYSVVQAVSRELASKFNLSDIVSFIGDKIASTLNLREIHILTQTSGGNFGEVYSSSSEKNSDVRKEVRILDDQGNKGRTVDEDSEVIKLLNILREVTIKDGRIANLEQVKRINGFFDAFNCEAVVPVYADDKLELLLLLGGKTTGDIFQAKDVSLLNTIAHQTSAAVRHVRLHQANLRSEKLAAIGMMSATFAHEIRNPLTSLKTCAQLMPEKYDDADFRDTFSKIVRDDVKKIEALIKDLLDFSSSEIFSGSDNYDLTAVIDEAIESIQHKHTIEKRKILIEKQYGSSSIKMRGSVNMLSRAFGNIINNGCQAMDRDGLMKVDIRPNGRYVTVSIQDNGRGISNEEMTKIFYPFYTTKPLGMGLGLAISKRIIEEHGGKIMVKSRPSQGTLFTVSLPILNRGCTASERGVGK
jgi:signal transduction histidine kinase